MAHLKLIINVPQHFYLNTTQNLTFDRFYVIF
jgi:hypothetical protein